MGLGEIISDLHYCQNTRLLTEPKHQIKNDRNRDLSIPFVLLLFRKNCRSKEGLFDLRRLGNDPNGTLFL